MLARNRHIGRHTATPFVNFQTLTRAQFLLPQNPAHMIGSPKANVQYRELHSGFETIITPGRSIFYSGNSYTARRSGRKRWEVEFPEVLEADWVRIVQTYVDRGKPIAIWLPAALPNPEGGESLGPRSRDLMWTEDGSSYYTKAYPWAEQSLTIRERDGTIVYQYTGSSNTIDTYGLEVDGSNGRVTLGSVGNGPPFGEFFADYELVLYGRVIEAPIEPLPHGARARYGPRLTIQETAFPVATKAFRWHLINELPSTTEIPTETASSDTPEDWGTPMLGSLKSTIHTTEWFKSYTVPALPLGHAMWGVFVSDPLPDQIVQHGTVCSLVGSYLHNGPPQTTLALKGFVYIWRKGIGVVAALSNSDRTNLATTVDGTSSDGSFIFGGIICSALNEDVIIEEGDRLVVELWGSAAGEVLATFRGDSISGDHAFGTGLAGIPDSTSWVQFSNPLWTYEN